MSDVLRPGVSGPQHASVGRWTRSERFAHRARTRAKVADWDCDVSLVAEPTDPHDRNAIAVHSSRALVAYLPPEVAPDFAELLSEVHQLGYDGIKCCAVMTGGEPGRGLQGLQEPGRPL